MTVQEFHKVAESIIDKTLVRQESCCSTCTLATCCHETVYVGKDEVEWMLASMTPEQLDYIKDKTAEWSVKAVGTGMLKEKAPSAYKWITHKIACPFLKDRKCMAYERRPMSCRMWFAKDTPENCDMPGRLKQQHAVFPPTRGDGIAAYFAQRTTDGTLHMDHLGAILSEILFNIDLHTGAKITVHNMEEQLSDEPTNEQTNK